MNGLSEQFLAWLAKTPAAIAQFVAIARLWYENQGKVAAPAGGGAMVPHEWKAGDPVVLTTVPISDEEIQAVCQGYARAEIKEKVIKFIEGFILGVAVAA